MEKVEILLNAMCNNMPMLSALITLIHLMHRYFNFLLVNDECKILEGGNIQ